MTNLHTSALLTLLAAAASLAAHADPIGFATTLTTLPHPATATLAHIAQSQGEPARSQGIQAIVATEEDQTPAAGFQSIFASAPIPIGPPTLSLRPFTITGDEIQFDDPTPTPDADSSVAPEPAGLLLLGTGAFATALSIRRRLFSF